MVHFQTSIKHGLKVFLALNLVLVWMFSLELVLSLFMLLASLERQDTPNGFESRERLGCLHWPRKGNLEFLCCIPEKECARGCAICSDQKLSWPPLSCARYRQVDPSNFLNRRITFDQWSKNCVTGKKFTGPCLVCRLCISLVPFLWSMKIWMEPQALFQLSLKLVSHSPAGFVHQVATCRLEPVWTSAINEVQKFKLSSSPCSEWESIFHRFEKIMKPVVRWVQMPEG